MFEYDCLSQLICEGKYLWKDHSNNGYMLSLILNEIRYKFLENLKYSKIYSNMTFTPYLFLHCMTIHLIFFLFLFIIGSAISNKTARLSEMWMKAHVISLSTHKHCYHGNPISDIYDKILTNILTKHDQNRI